MTRFLDAYRSRGGLHRAAEASPASIRRPCAKNVSAIPSSTSRCSRPREYYADLVEETMLASADRSDNPVGFIVRLKALRPDQYIERHAVMSVSLSAELPGHDAAELLRAMLGTLTDSSRTLLSAGPPPALPPPPP